MPKANGKKRLQLLFTLVGLGSLIYLIKSYGFSELIGEFQETSFSILFLILTFIPTLFLYGLSWMLMTELPRSTGPLHWSFRFFYYSMISIAWNNLTPFLKMGGEPFKYFLLRKHVGKQNSMQSTIGYNLIHIVSTLLAFCIASFLILNLFNITNSLKFMTLIIGLISLFLAALILWGLFKKNYLRIPKIVRKKEFLRKSLIPFFFALRRVNRFGKKRPLKIIFALISDTFARFAEGLTFYVAALLLSGKKISFLVCSLLDVSRTLIDTALFFIPFQMGGREEGIRMTMSHLFNEDAKSFLYLSLSYRFVEIAWIILGYMLWIFVSKSLKRPTEKSAPSTALSSLES